jgi:hypothetical protein
MTTDREVLTRGQIIDIWADVSADHDDSVNIVTLARAVEQAVLAALSEPEAQPSDEDIADAIECEFSATGEWPDGDVAVVRAFLKHFSKAEEPKQAAPDPALPPDSAPGRD